MEVTVGLLIGLMPILLTIDSQRIRRPEKREQDKGKNQSVEQSEHWPNNGMIALSNVNFKYSSDGPLVLKDLTTDIKPGEKVCLSHLPL